MRRQRAALERRAKIRTAMNYDIPSITIGLDLGDKTHAICALDAAGKVIDERSITNHRESLRRLSQKHPGARIALEVGTHSPWVSRFLRDLGHEVIVANPRKLRAIYTSDRKSDKNDAQMIARIARMDTKLLHPIQHGSEESQRDLLRMKMRDTLVRQRVCVINSVRFTLKSLGVALPKAPSSDYFARRCRSLLQEGDKELLEMLEPMLQSLDVMSVKIKEMDKAVEKLCAEKYPVTGRLRQICGIGPVTALNFVLVIEDPERFANPRDVGAYLGLVPRRDQSGGLDKKLRISKAGDAYLRQLLVGSAQHLLGPFGKDCDLRRHGHMLAARGGKPTKKQAVVAIARKLAVLMLVLWKDGKDYEPLRNEPPAPAQAA
jgi:transposase